MRAGSNGGAVWVLRPVLFSRILEMVFLRVARLMAAQDSAHDHSWSFPECMGDAM